MGETTKDVRLRLDVEQTGDTGAPAEQAEQLSALDERGRAAAAGLQELTAAAEAYSALSPEDDWATQSQVAEQLAGGIIEARLALIDYAAAIEAAQAAGDVVDPAEIERLKQLEIAYQRAAQAANQTGQAATGAGTKAKAAGKGFFDGSENVRSLDGMLKRGIPTWAQYAGGVAAALAVFKEAYQVGTQLREGLNAIGRELGLGNIADELVRATPQFKLWEKFVNTLYETSSGSKTLENSLKILRANGIDPTGLSAAQVAAKVDALGKEMQGLRNEAQRAADEFKKWSEDLGVSKAELDELSESLARNLRTFAEQNRQLSQADLGGVFGDQIQELLDGYERLRQEPPEAIKELADAWGVLSSAQEEAVERGKELAEEAAEAQRASIEKQKAALADQVKAEQEAIAKRKALVDDYFAAITGAAVRSEQELRERSAALLQALAQLQGTDLIGPEQTTAAGEAVRKLLEEYRAAGVEIPAIITQVATSLGVLKTGWQDVAAAARDANKAQAEETKNNLTNLGVLAKDLIQDFGDLSQTDPFGDLGEGSREASDHVKAVVEEFRAAGVAIPQEIATIADAAGVIVRAYEVADESLDQVLQGAQVDAAAAAAELRDTGAAAGDLATAVAQAASEMAATEPAGQAAAEGTAIYQQALSGLVGELQAFMEGGTDLEHTLFELSEVGEAVPGIDAAAGSLDAIVQKAEAAGISVPALKEALMSAAEEASRGSQDFEDWGEVAGDSVGAFEDLAGGAEAAQAGLQGAAGAQQELADASTAAQDGATGTADALAKIAGPGREAEDVLRRIGDAAATAGGAIAAGLQPGIDAAIRMKGALEAALTAATNLANAGGGGGEPGGEPTVAAEG